MKKRAMALVLILGMLLLLLSGCGGQAAPGSSAPEQVSSAQAPASDQAEPEAEAEAEPAPEPEPESASEAEASAEAAPEEAEAEPEPEPEGYVYSGEWATYPLAEPGELNLTMWCEFPGFLNMVGLDSYNNMSVWKAAEEATGVHVDFTEVSMMNASEQFSLMCAANDMKDILGGAVSYYGSSAGAIEEEIIIDLAEPAEQYMGNYMTILNDPKYASYKEKAYNSEGQMAEISSISDDFKPTSGAQIRRDWLEALNLEVPKTYDDWETVLLAFKEAHGCNNTLLLSGVTQFDNLISGYATKGASEASMGGNSVNMYQIDGVVRNGYMDDSYQAYLSMMHRWYTEGLMSPDFITASSDGATNNMDGTILSGDAGIWFSQGNFIAQYEQQAQVTEPEFSIMGIADPYSPEWNDGPVTHFTQMSGGGQGGNGSLSVSTNCQDVEMACKWMDYFWTEEGQLLCNYGIEGEGFEYGPDGKPHFSDFVLSGVNLQFMMVGYTLSGAPTLSDFDKAFFTYTDNVLEAFDTWAASVDDKYTLPASLTLNTEQSERYSLLFGDITTMAQERIGRFITGELDVDADWPAFQADLKQMGIEECVAIYQEAYDAYVESHS